MAFKLKSLQEIWSVSEAKKSSKETVFQLKQAELQLESDILATEQALLSAKENLDKILSYKKGFNSLSILEGIETVKSLEKGLKELNFLKKSLFPKN